ncbi:MAG: transposase family protein [Gemmatimonadetes bacterium]|jgi:putative transposase|nr:transposase family protein [Gemmatimonadota bacterium]
MRPSKFTEAQIVQALQEVRCGTTAAAVCRSLGITQTTFYRWRARYEGAALETARHVRQLEEENRRLKQLVAELLLEKSDTAVPRPRRR